MIVGQTLKQLHQGEGQPSKPAWQRFLESTGGTALITVLLGGIIGGWITANLQSHLRQREIGLASYNEYLKLEQGVVTRAYEAVGSSIAAAEDLISLTDPAFGLERFEGEERKFVAEQRRQLREKFNKRESEWRGEKEKLGLLMSYYHQGKPEVAAAWRTMQRALDAYLDCAQKAYIEKSAGRQGEIDSRSICKNERETLDRSLQTQNASLEGGALHAWQKP